MEKICRLLSEMRMDVDDRKNWQRGSVLEAADRSFADVEVVEAERSELTIQHAAVDDCLSNGHCLRVAFEMFAVAVEGHDC